MIKNDSGAKSAAAEAAKRAAEEARKRADEAAKAAAAKAAAAAKKPTTFATKAVAFKADELSSGRGGALRANASKLLGASSLSSPPPAEWRQTTTALNLRTVPSATGNDPVGLVPPGASVKVTPDAAGQTRKDGFVHVEWNDGGKAQTGWISEQYTTPTVDPATKPGPAAGTALYTSGELNLRGVPSKEGNEPLALIPPGAKLEVTVDPATGKTGQGDFVHVAWDDNGTRRDGWVFGPYTSTTPTSAAAAPQPAAAGPETVIANVATGLNLRADPNTKCEVLGEVPQGEKLTVTPDANGQTRTADGWVHVEWKDQGVTKQGWVSEKLTLPGALADAQAIHINQFDAEKTVTDVDGKAGDGTNTNCGPTAVVIALRDQGLTIPSIPGISQTGDGADVQAARYWAYKDSDTTRDGVVTNADGSVSYASMKAGENSTITYFSDLQNAVTAAGGKANWLGQMSPDGQKPADWATGVAYALQNGKSVVLSGNFLTDEGKAKTDVWKRGGGAQEHVVAVTGMTSDGKFIVNDPALRQPVVVTAEQLNSFMSNNGGGLVVSR
ncbi:MAG: SH3 domain-containing protein [Myxococcota bacterium]